MASEIENMKKLGTTMQGKRAAYEADRRLIELQWLKNLRQYNRQYDPDVWTKIKKKDRSKAYPGDTRIKVDGETAKMMEMMFPAQERNWELDITPVPSIAVKDLQDIISDLEALEETRAIEEVSAQLAAQAEATGQEPQAPTQEQVDQAVKPLESDTIERAVKAFATERKNAMEEEIADQLADPKTDYSQMMKRAVRSGTIYGIGIVRSPQVRTLDDRTFVLDPETGRYNAVKKKERRPYPEFVRCWDYYPDLSARIWEDQEGGFERIVVNRFDFEQFGKRDDFDSEAVTKYLKEHPTGNYVPKNYDNDLQVIADDTDTANRNGRRYEVYRWLGFVSGHDLKEAGIDIPEDEVGEVVFTDLWIVDDVVIKAEKASFGERPTDVYHSYIPSEDEDSGLTGVGLPENVRDSQMSICATNRALMDNMAAVAGPILEVNTELMPLGRKAVGSIHAFMTIEREGEGQSASAPAVRPIFIPSHISEIMAILEMQRKQLDVESNIPAWTMGSPEGLGEAFRTSTNMSQMGGGANMVTKDHVRAFDKLTNGVIGSMLSWNMEFNTNDEIKGDFQARAKGSISLVAKEVQGAALDQLTANMTPEEHAMTDTYGLLEDKFKSRDLPVTRLLPRDIALKNVQQMQEGQAAAQQAEAGLTTAKTAKENATAAEKTANAQATGQTTEAMIDNMISQTALNMANAKSPEEKQKLEMMKLLLEGVKDVPNTPEPG